ncbi:MAG: glycosyltransferase family A protein [Nitrospirota bacterium]
MNTQGLLISVIIPTYLRPSSLKRCLISLSKQYYPKEKFEVLIINDGGEPSQVEDIADELKREFNLSLFHQHRQGVAGARMSGIIKSCGIILAFLDDDCTVPKDYLANIEKAFQSYSGHVAVQPLLDNPEPDNIYGQAWKYVYDETLKANLQTTRQA